MGCLENCRYLIHDRDTKFTDSFRAIAKSGNVEPLKLPARSPNLNAHAERGVKSVKDECLSKLILFGEASLRRALREYLVHYHAERNHQGKGNVLLHPLARHPIPIAVPRRPLPAGNGSAGFSNTTIGKPRELVDHTGNV